MARPEGRHEDLRLADLAGVRIEDLHRRTGVVDEGPLACGVRLAQHRVEPGAPHVVARTELGVAVAPAVVRRARVRLLILEPEQLQRHARPSALRMHGRPVRDRAHQEQRQRLRSAEQLRFQRGVVERRRHRPPDAAGAEAPHIRADGTLGEPQAPGNLLLTPAGLVDEAQHVHHLAHGYPLCSHSVAPGIGSPNDHRLRWDPAVLSSDGHRHRPKRPIGLARTRPSTSAETDHRLRPKRAIDMDRNTQGLPSASRRLARAFCADGAGMRCEP